MEGKLLFDKVNNTRIGRNNLCKIEDNWREYKIGNAKLFPYLLYTCIIIQCYIVMGDYKIRIGFALKEATGLISLRVGFMGII